MNRTLSSARLDFYTIKPYKRSFLLMAVMSIVMTVSFQSLATLCSYVMMCLILTMSYPFSIGDKNGMDTLYAVLPLQRGNTVRGRYAFALCMELIGVLCVVAVSLVLSALTSMELVLSEMLLSLCVSSFVFSMMVAIQYPIYFKLGYDKAKFIAYIPLMLIFMTIMLVPNLLPNIKFTLSVDYIQRLVEVYSFIVCSLLVITGLILLALSCRLSVKLYEKRDI